MIDYSKMMYYSFVLKSDRNYMALIAYMQDGHDFSFEETYSAPYGEYDYRWHL